MNKKAKSLLFAAVALSLVSVLTMFLVNAAPLLGSVGIINNTDMFYSPYEYINFSLTTITVPGDTATSVQVNLTLINASACGGTGYLNLTNTSAFGNPGDSVQWIGGCAVSTFFNNSITTPVLITGGNFTFIAYNSTRGTNTTTSLTPIILQNLGVPPQMNSDCPPPYNVTSNPGTGQRFGSLMTNMSNILDFSNVNFIIQVEMNGSCLHGPNNGSSPWNGFQQVMMMNFSSLNMSSPTIGQRLQGLKDALQVSIVPPHMWGPSRIYINETAFAELNTNTTITLNNLPFTGLPIITPDNASRSKSNVLFINQTPFDFTVGDGTTHIIVPRGDLRFSVEGFTGWNASDTLAPLITLVSPAGNVTAGSSVISVLVNGTITDPAYIFISLNASLNYSYYGSDPSKNTAHCFNMSAVDLETLNCTFLANLSVGPYILNVSAWDYGGPNPEGPGNYNNSVRAFSAIPAAPPAAPVVTIVSPINSGYYSNRTRLVNLTVANNASVWFFNGTGNTTYGSPVFMTFNEGSNTLIAYANNSVGVINSSTSTFTIDSTPAVITLTSPANGTYYNTNSVAFTFSAIGNSSIIDCNFLLDGVENISSIKVANTINVSTITGLSNALHNWTVECYENNGDPTNDTGIGPAYNISETRWFTVDTIKPAPSITSLTNGQNLSNATIGINVTVVETNYNHSTITLLNSSGSNMVAPATNTSKNFNITIAAPAEGSYIINVTSYDLAGNSNSTSKSVTVDTTAPVITVTSPANGSTYYANHSILVSATMSDLTPRVFWYNSNGTTNITDGASLNVNINYTSNQTATIIIYANDSFNRIATAVKTIIIASAVPANTTLATTQNNLTINETQTAVIVAPNSSLQTVNVNSSTLSGTVDLSQINHAGTATIANNLTLTRINSTTTNYTVVIRANTNIIGGAGWDGTLVMPIVNTTSFTAPSSGTTNVVITVGSSTSVNFSQPVEIIISGMSGKKAAWSSGGTTLMDISTACNSGNTTNATAPTNIDAVTTRECYLNDGSGLIIWTYHFTSFAAYTPAEAAVVTAPGAEGDGGGCLTTWKCSEWSGCVNGNQTRTCEKEKSYCSAGAKPSETQACIVPSVEAAKEAAKEAEAAKEEAKKAEKVKTGLWIALAAIVVAAVIISSYLMKRKKA